MFEAIIGGIVSFIAVTIFFHPKSKVNKKLPEKRIKNFQIAPRVNFSVRNKVIHIHHWFYLIPVFVFVNNLNWDIARGVVLGGIVQGLFFKDRFKFIYKKDEYNATIKSSTMHAPLLGRMKRRFAPNLLSKKP